MEITLLLKVLTKDLTDHTLNGEATTNTMVVRLLWSNQKVVAGTSVHLIQLVCRKHIAQKRQDLDMLWISMAHLKLDLFLIQQVDAQLSNILGPILYLFSSSLSEKSSRDLTRNE